MKRGLRTLFIVLGVVVFLGQTVRQAPASLGAHILQRQVPGLSYSKTSGRLWSGVLDDAVLRGIPLGRVAFDMNGWRLLTGKVEVSVDLRGGAVIGDLKAVGSSGRLRITAGAVTLQLADLSRSSALGVPVGGTARADIRSLVIARTACLSGDFDVWTDFLTVSAQQWGADGFPLAGDGKCVDGMMTVEMAGNGEEASAQVGFALARDASYSMTVTVESAQPDVANALGYIGFEPRNGDLYYETSGSFRSLQL